MEALDRGATVSATMILDAIARLDAHEQTATVVRWTKVVGMLTVVIAVATIINVVLFVARG